ncbi:AraC family transcriptional regulator [Halomonas salifodinae]|uniref:AraC family transcriptional regulator n=1 Tax=Halomonas salifodinae TaxID=438745 RepID=UPI0033B3993C
MVSDSHYPSPASADGIVVLRRPVTGLTLHQRRPQGPLRHVVQSLWWAQGSAAGSGQGVELLHPDGGLGVVFNFGTPPGREVWPGAGPAWVDGPSLRTGGLAVTAGLALLGVRFLPGWGGALLGEPPERLAEAGLLPAGALRRPALAELHDRLREIDDGMARVALLERELLGWLRQSEAPSPLLGAALEWQRRRHGQGSVAELAEALSVSPRRLQRLFRGQLGLSPKQYARVLRVARGRTLIKRAEGPGALTEAAYAAGYCDQAHFVHDFTAVTGLTPGEYRRHVQQREGGVRPALMSASPSRS